MSFASYHFCPLCPYLVHVPIADDTLTSLEYGPSLRVTSNPHYSYLGFSDILVDVTPGARLAAASAKNCQITDACAVARDM